MRIAGIDPGSKSYDFFGKEDNKVILDVSVPSAKVANEPQIILEIIESIAPVDIIIGPSGYGIPLTSANDATGRDLLFMLPDNTDDSVAVNRGIREMFKLMKTRNMPTYFTPGVIHLPTVPDYRKTNKLDMGTADKLCAVALGMKDQAKFYGIDYKNTSFILVEAGFGFTAVIGVKNGEVVDGIGGSSGCPGFLASGGVDSEIAIRLVKQHSQAIIFTGGVRDFVSEEDITIEEITKGRHKYEKYEQGWKMFLEGILKDVAMMLISVENPREILLSGRAFKIQEIEEELKSKLSKFCGTVRKVCQEAKVAKESAEGAYIIGEGLLGGKYKGITDSLRIREARGTMFDHIFIKGVKSEIFPS